MAAGLRPSRANVSPYPSAMQARAGRARRAVRDGARCWGGVTHRGVAYIYSKHTAHNVITQHAASCRAVHRAPCTLHAARCTLHPARCTLHAAPSTLHAARCTQHAARCTLHAANSALRALRTARSTYHDILWCQLHQFSANEKNLIAQRATYNMRKARAVRTWVEDHLAVCQKSPEDAVGSGEPAFGGDFPLPHRSYRVGCL